MPRIRLLPDEELTAGALQQVQATEAAGSDATVLRAVANRPDMFEDYFKFYYPSHQQGIVEPDLKELVRLKVARLNDCFT